MEDHKSLDELLRLTLSKMHEEYETFSTHDLLKISDSERETYFSRYTMYKELIGSIESFLIRNQKLQQLEPELRD